MTIVNPVTEQGEQVMDEDQELRERGRQEGYTYAKNNPLLLSDKELENLGKRESRMKWLGFYVSGFMFGYRAFMMERPVTLTPVQCEIIETVDWRYRGSSEWTTVDDLTENSAYSREQIEEAFQVCPSLLRKDRHGIVRLSPDKEETEWLQHMGLVKNAETIHFWE